ncbi:hypothetical protein LLH00_06310, partial [bacterium]|nr:hypothetical protein [bacterium]
MRPSLGRLSFFMLLAATSVAYPSGMFVNYTNGNAVTSLALQGDSILWAGTLGGVVRWDLPSGAAQKFTTDAGLAGNSVQAVAVDSLGNLWCGTSGFGVSRYDGHGWRTFKNEFDLLQKPVTGIAQDFQGRIWFGTYNDYAFSYDGSTWKAVSWQDGLANNGIHALERDSRG